MDTILTDEQVAILAAAITNQPSQHNAKPPADKVLTDAKVFYRF